MRLLWGLSIVSEYRNAGQGAANNPWNFMGFDLRQLPELWVSGWKEALSWPVLRWLKISSVVRVYYADGTRGCYINDLLVVSQSADKTPNFIECEGSRFRALILPDDILLHRSMVLPKMQAADLHRTLQFEVDAITPFSSDQTLWGYAINDQQGAAQQIELALTSRAHLNKVAAQLVPPVHLNEFEVWGLSDRSQPIVLKGFSESRRKRYVRRRMLQIVLLLLAIPMLIVAIAGVPMVAAQVRLSHAQQLMAALESKSSMAETQRGTLLAQSQSGQIVLDYIKTLPQPLPVLDLLSQHIPDTAFLERFDMNPKRTQITGQADNAAALTQALGALPQLQNVHAPSAITRNPQNNKERFTLEFSVTPSYAHEK